MQNTLNIIVMLILSIVLISCTNRKKIDVYLFGLDRDVVIVKYHLKKMKCRNNPLYEGKNATFEIEDFFKKINNDQNQPNSSNDNIVDTIIYYDGTDTIKMICDSEQTFPDTDTFVYGTIELYNISDNDLIYNLSNYSLGYNSSPYYASVYYDSPASILIRDEFIRAGNIVKIEVYWPFIISVIPFDTTITFHLPEKYRDNNNKINEILDNRISVNQDFWKGFKE